jgi:hypothetical protein
MRSDRAQPEPGRGLRRILQVGRRLDSNSPPTRCVGTRNKTGYLRGRDVKMYGHTPYNFE